MIVFFIVLTVLFFLSLILFMLCASNLEIEVNKFWFDSNNNKNEKIKDYLFYIRLKSFGKITWFKVKIDDKKIVKIKNQISKIFEKIIKSNNLKDIIIKNRSEIFNLDNIRILDIMIKRLNLQIKLSAIDSILTSFSIVIISTIISIILARSIKKYQKDKYNYVISPIYETKPIFKIKLNCIIDIKIVHIMNIIYILIKKRSVVYDKRTSDRRTYVCSND